MHIGHTDSYKPRLEQNEPLTVIFSIMFSKYKNWIHTLGPLKYNVGNRGRGEEWGVRIPQNLFFYYIE